ncbi:dystroglycan 1-like [Diadema antillarum]|uniref:dystroglycan 1-like n=1 Tax=Diadema antillarum TaxID=105358 RepID=UPI003A8B7E32
MPTSAMASETMPDLSPVMSSTPSLPSLPTSVLPMVSSTEMISSQILLSPSSSDNDMTSTLSVTSALPTTPPSDITTEPQNQPPYLQYPVDEIVTTSGDVLLFSIPENTFMDFEDGSTRNLHLNLLDAEGNPVSQSNWLQLDEDQQILLGVPLGNNVTRMSNSYFLSATDTGGLVGYDAFVVDVLERPTDFTHEYIVTLANDFNDFVDDGLNIVSLCQRIASFVGDSGADAISVESVRDGSVVITYSNKTISRSGCDSEAINAVFYQLVDGNGSLSEDFRESLKPEFSVTSVERIFLGPCLVSTTPMTTYVTLLPVGPSKHLLMTVVPAVVIALSFLLFCIIILFCLYKRKRGGEEFLLRDEKKIYAKNRKPIYLDGELEDTEPTGIANPVVLPEDFEPVKSFRPPKKATSTHLPKPQYRQPPPEYRLPDFAKVNLEMDKPDLLAAASEPPKYSSWPAHNDMPLSEFHGTKPPPLYRLPPPYQSRDSGLFNESDI